MRKPAILASVALLSTVVVPTARADEAARRRLRDLGERAVFVVQGGRNPVPDYRGSDAYDHDNAIAKASALADATYANRIIVSDLLTSDDTRFRHDLARIGRSLEAGQVMLAGPRFDARQRIPLAIPEDTHDTCTGPCLTAYQTCTNQPQVTEITRRMTHAERWCLYWHFRRDLDAAIQAAIASVQGEHIHAFGDAPVAQGRRNTVAYNAIALGTPVSFYSHNPKKPVGYYYDAKRVPAQGEPARCTDTLDQGFGLVHQNGAPTCSDFDLKIYSPDLAYLLVQEAARINHVDQELAAWTAGEHDADEADAKNAEVQALKAALPINLAIVDGGKQHVFKNRTNANTGAYQIFPALGTFARTWTAALGREVDIKLEFSFAAPSYVNLPGGPIAVLNDQDPDYALPANAPQAPPPPDERDDHEADNNEGPWVELLGLVAAVGLAFYYE